MGGLFAEVEEAELGVAVGDLDGQILCEGKGLATAPEKGVSPVLVLQQHPLDHDLGVPPARLCVNRLGHLLLDFYLVQNVPVFLALHHWRVPQVCVQLLVLVCVQVHLRIVGAVELSDW